MEFTKYSASAHHIRRKSIDPDALYILSKLTKNGYESYLVGGGVRDLLMGHVPKDFDIATSARPEEIKKLFRHCLLIGRRFRLAHVRFGNKVIEVSTFRAGDTNEENLIIRDNIWGHPEEDVMRRDFTINGLYYCASDDTIIDYVGGYEDLAKRLLRTIGNPELRFKQDPVRMIRLLKFRARFGLAVESKTWEALESCKQEIVKSSPARVLEEILKMLESGSSLPFMRQMCATELLKYIFPTLSHNLESDISSKIFKNLETIDLIIQRNKRKKPDRAVVVSAILFPLLEKALPVVNSHEKLDYNLLMNTIYEVIENVLTKDFPSFPKKLKSIIAFIMNAQLRLTPLDGRMPHRSRIVHHPEFLLALQLLYIRSLSDEKYKENYHFWEEHYAYQRMPRKKKKEYITNPTIKASLNE